MPVQSLWDDDQQTVVRLHFTGRWTWDELQDTTLQTIAMMQSCPVRVDLISDMLDTIFLPPRYVDSLKPLTEHYPLFPNLRMVVLAGTNKSYASLFEQVRPMSPALFEVAYASSLDMARALIARSRSGDESPSGYVHWASGN